MEITLNISILFRYRVGRKPIRHQHCLRTPLNYELSLRMDSICSGMSLQASSRIKGWGNWGISTDFASGAEIGGISTDGATGGASLAGRIGTELTGTSNTAGGTPRLGALMKGCSPLAPDGAS
ncbi:conserved hypothetical protein [Ricinus communis]|uniref:Uncharacterized protein n=1 Tax=Ricinus communis TaxID=3988 RepID=B9SZN6_RICCO|nr:conserved hypothetical protein [Ricinus communis]